MNKRKILLIALFLVGTITPSLAQNHILSGFVKEKNSGELLIGAGIYLPQLKNGITTNNYGYYAISIPSDTLDVIFSMVGYQKQVFRIALKKDITLNVDLLSGNAIKEVVVTDDRMEKIADDPQMSIVRIPIEQIKKIPMLFGEKDVLKTIQLMPGVQKGSEGNAGLYVRGGGPDQNLIILDDAPVYNAFHLFGFFSLFNGDALKSVDLYKGGFPARFGGRLSSVLEMNMKDGNKQAAKVEFGIGLLSTKFTVEAPIKKNKSSFLISGRRTYIDALTLPFQTSDSKGGYFFYDFNAKLNYEISQKDRIYLSGYFGRDKFYSNDLASSNYQSTFSLFWGNATGTLRWNHLYSNRLFANTSVIFSNYQFNIQNKETDHSDFFEIKLFSGIRDFTIKHDLDYALHPNHTLKIGISLQQHRFTPSGTTINSSSIGDLNINNINSIDALESGLYAEDNFKIGQRFKANAGIRFANFLVQGKTYTAIEPRLSASYLIKEDLSVKASFASMNQFIHLLSSTGTGLPTDLWVPSTAKVKPQQSNQVALGLAKDFLDKNLTFSIESFYKKSDRVVAYKDGASFLNIDVVDENDKIVWEDNLTAGQGWSYGTEFLLQRSKGPFSGWIGYTLSWTQLQFDEINFGKKYFARYDRRHDVSVVGIYEIDKEKTFSFTWVYGTGNAITLPKGDFLAPSHNPGSNNNWSNIYATEYGAKNDFRMEAYHRFDFGLQFHKQLKRGIRTFEFSVYNAYNRRNPYFYYISKDNTGSQNVLKKISLFPTLPSFTWTYKF